MPRGRKSGVAVHGGRPRTADLGRREQRILRTAGEAFLRHGFDGTTMDAVAEAARISKRTLYARHADKAALFDAVLRDLIGRWLVPIDRFQAGSGTLKGTLLALARYLVTFALLPQSIGVNRIIISEAGRHPGFGRLANEMGREPSIGVVASILQRHRRELRAVDLELAAEQFMSLAIDRNLLLAHLGIAIGPKRIEQWTRAAVDLFLSGVSLPKRDGPRAGRPKPDRLKPARPET